MLASKLGDFRTRTMTILIQKLTKIFQSFYVKPLRNLHLLRKLESMWPAACLVPLGSEAWRINKINVLFMALSLRMISFVLFPQASQPSMNFNISKLVY